MAGAVVKSTRTTRIVAPEVLPDDLKANIDDTSRDLDTAPVEGTASTEHVSKEETATDTFIDVDRLQSCGLNVADILKIKQAGYRTILSLLQATRKDLLQIKGFAEGKVEKVIEAAQSLDQTASTFQSAGALLKKRANVLKISSGSVALDKLLLGGIESAALTEVYGENRSGKTQICHTLCVTAQLPISLGGGNGKVCYIDTEGTFRPEKIASIASRFQMDPGIVLDNIMYGRAHTHEHLNQLICMAACKFVEEPFSLLVVDSIMALFRVEFSGRGELAERQQVLGKTLNRLQRISEQFNLAVVYTNHVMADPSGAMTMVANPSKPIGGFVLGHASTHRLQLRIGRGDTRICKIIDSPILPPGDALIQLTEQGITDPTGNVVLPTD